jgi:hypothetical protein
MRFKKWLGLVISLMLIVTAALAIFTVMAQDTEEEAPATNKKSGSGNERFVLYDDNTRTDTIA